MHEILEAVGDEGYTRKQVGALCLSCKERQTDAIKRKGGLTRCRDEVLFRLHREMHMALSLLPRNKKKKKYFTLNS